MLLCLRGVEGGGRQTFNALIKHLSFIGFAVATHHPATPEMQSKTWNEIFYGFLMYDGKWLKCSRMPCTTCGRFASAPHFFFLSSIYMYSCGLDHLQILWAIIKCSISIGTQTTGTAHRSKLPNRCIFTFFLHIFIFILCTPRCKTLSQQ